MQETKFYSVRDLQDACSLLAQYKEKAQILAGGTDLMVKINRKLASPQVLIYIGESGLSYIKEEEGNILIGAATTFSDIAGSALVQEKLPLLVEVVQNIGSPAIRNMGTIGGNLANASPAADSAVALLALGARLKLFSANGERIVDSSEFFSGPGETLLQPSELLQEVIIPSQGPEVRWAYRKLGRRRADTLSVVSAAICLKMENDKCSNVRIALGAVAPTPLLVTKAEELLVGKKPDSALIDIVAKAAAEETSPIDDVRATAWYRRQASEVLVRRLLSQILG